MIYFIEKWEKIEEKESIANARANIVRTHKTECEHCHQKVDNSKDEKGRYHKWYYIWDDNFLCDKCKNKKMVKDNLMLIMFLSIVVIILTPYYLVPKMAKRVAFTIRGIKPALWTKLDTFCTCTAKMFRMFSDLCMDRWRSSMENFEVSDIWFKSGIYLSGISIYWYKKSTNMFSKRTACNKAIYEQLLQSIWKEKMNNGYKYVV